MTYLCTKIIIKLAQLRKEGKTLESLLENLAEPIESKEIRMNILTEDFRAYGEKVIEDCIVIDNIYTETLEIIEWAFIYSSRHNILTTCI